MRSILRVINNLFSSKTIILLYHRVIDLEIDPQLLAVSPKNFRKQMLHLKKNYKIISLDLLVNNLKERKIPRKSIVITFDDGYVDNYLYAKPILEELKIPATFFLTTANIGQDKEFWWDSLERMFLLERKSPPLLKLKIKGQKRRWRLETRKQKKETYQQIQQLLLELSSKEIERIIKYLLRWANLKEKARVNYRPMDEEEIKEITKKAIMTIGSHGHSHCRLAKLSESDQVKEIVQSKKTLEKITETKIRHFSYPFGTSSDFDQQTIKIVQNCGFDSACANFPSVVTKKSDVYQLPRFLIRNWDLGQFKEEIKRFFA